MKKGSVILIVIAVILVIAGIFAGVIFKKFNDYKAYVADLTIDEVNLETIADGVYTGEADANVIRVIVDVTVKDHIITDVALIKHENGQGDPANVIVDRIQAEQKILVDSVSGATNSSRMIMKAVENALTGAQEE